MPDGLTPPHFRTQGAIASRFNAQRDYPTGCFKKYMAWLRAEMERDRAVHWLLFEINCYDPAEKPRPFGWETRERARAIIEEREPWPEYLLPYKSLRQNAYYHGRRKVEIPTWLNPDNWTVVQLAQARLEKAAKEKFLRARNNRFFFDHDREGWSLMVRAAHRELEAVRRRWEEQKRLTFARSARVPSISSLKRSALRGMRR